jgi:VIT1/CCC1 family predicted Fe2+/Mn2+ transporter
VRLVADELDETLAGITSEARRFELYRDIVARVKSGGEPRRLLGWKDIFAAIAAFWSVIVASFPAVLPYFVIDDPWLALRTSNALLILVLFWVGYKWAGYTTIKPWVAASSLTGLGILLVALAIPLGG